LGEKSNLLPNLQNSDVMLKNNSKSSILNREMKSRASNRTNGGISGVPVGIAGASTLISTEVNSRVNNIGRQPLHGGQKDHWVPSGNANQ